MSETKHTPGPWEVRSGGRNADGNRLHNIGRTAQPNSVVASLRLLGKESRANARLIAASPDLLATLKDILDFLRHSGYDCRIVKAAIAKATEPN